MAGHDFSLNNTNVDQAAVSFDKPSIDDMDFPPIPDDPFVNSWHMTVFYIFFDIFRGEPCCFSRKRVLYQGTICY